MTTKTIHGITIELIQGDIANQPYMDAIVNAGNAELRMGDGVAGAIHTAAGPELERESSQYAPIKPGQAVITGAHGLPNKYVIHCLGPVYGHDMPSDRLLESCYRNALDLAESNEIKSIAFPAISTGVFGYPMEPAAEIAFKTILRKIPELSSVKHIRFVLWNDNHLRVHSRVLEDLWKS